MVVRYTCNRDRFGRKVMKVLVKVKYGYEDEDEEESTLGMLGIIVANFCSPSAFITNKGYHLMDKKEPGKEVSEDVTRESLIALSYRLPEKDLALGFSPENLNSESLVEGIDGDGAERYRSKLISISYSESPEVKTVPVAPGESKG
ncbi:hypothetical protein TEA_028063 [Camellia sinensis var. sinensis]|uniref:Uncharacterized protein n=1 Tax=Camellia sinensis var. sinensis TaxID=542762 RepID=A0A4S4E4U4_CAMSN|nr:hypothetical protein TEA_028063 [Camellia sinensis var. sinensis]